MGMLGATPRRILLGIAAGLLGPQALKGGALVAAVGLGIHFLIAFTAAAVYYSASRKLTILTTHPIVCGLLYGEVVYAFMNFAVIPAAGLHRPPWIWPALVTGPAGHPFLVGLPIALAVRHFGRRSIIQP